MGELAEAPPPPRPPTIKDIRELAARLNEKREELEADLVAISNDALHAGVLVVTPWPENLDLSWLQCCSTVGDCPKCRPGDFTRAKKNDRKAMDRRRHRW